MSLKRPALCWVWTKSVMLFDVQYAHKRHRRVVMMFGTLAVAFGAAKSILLYSCILSLSCHAADPVLSLVFTPGGVWTIVMSMSVCLSVYSFNSKTAWQDFTKFCLHVAHGCGSVLFWQCCDTVCTSCFLDDIIGASGQNQAWYYACKKFAR